MRLASWIVGEMRKECLVAGTVIIVGRRLDWGILHAVALRVANRLYTSYRNWYDARAVWMVVSCHRAARLLAIIWYYRKGRSWNTMVE